MRGHRSSGFCGTERISPSGAGFGRTRAVVPAQALSTMMPAPMPEFVEIARTSELPVGRVKAFVVDGRTVAVYHTTSGFYATDNTCPHRGGPLAEGDLDRKSTRLNSSHSQISYAVFCLKKKKKKQET